MWDVDAKSGEGVDKAGGRTATPNRRSRFGAPEAGERQLNR